MIEIRTVIVWTMLMTMRMMMVTTTMLLSQEEERDASDTAPAEGHTPRQGREGRTRPLSRAGRPGAEVKGEDGEITKWLWIDHLRFKGIYMYCSLFPTHLKKNLKVR